MEKILNKIKAIAKILLGTTIMSFIGSFISIIVVFITGAGILGFILGMFIRIGSVALGAFIGGRWARINTLEIKNVRGLVIGSAVIYLMANLITSVASRVLYSMIGGVEIDLWTQVAQICAQSFVIYIASHFAIQQPLLKKKIIG